MVLPYMSNRARFKELFETNHDRFDFINSDGGTGGEFIAIYLTNNLDNYKSTKSDEHWGYEGVNRYGYNDRAFKNFFLKLSMYSQNHKVVFDTWDKVYDFWITLYLTDKHQSHVLDTLAEYLDNSKRVLVRTHGSFHGITTLFPNSIKIIIKPHIHKWRVYARILVGIKVLSAPIQRNKIAAKRFFNDTYNILTTTESLHNEELYGKPNLCPLDVFNNRLDSVLTHGHTLNSHTAYGMIMPYRLESSELKRSVDHNVLLKKVLSIDPIIFNTINYFWNDTGVGAQLKTFKDAEIATKELTNSPEYHRTNHKVFCIGDILHSNTEFCELMDINQSSFTKAITEWHQRNMDLIEEVEIDIGHRLLDVDLDYNTK